MNIFRNLLNKNIIDKKELIFFYQKQLGLTFDQTFLLCKLISFINEEKWFNIDLLVNKFDLDKEESELLIAQIYEKKLIEISMNNGKMILDFSNIWNKFDEWFNIPEQSSSLETKINWLVFNFNIPLNFDNKIIQGWLLNNFNDIIDFYQNNNSEKIHFQTLLSLLNDSQNSLETKNLIDKFLNIKSEFEDSFKSENKFQEIKNSESKTKLVQKNWLEE